MGAILIIILMSISTAISLSSLSVCYSKPNKGIKYFFISNMFLIITTGIFVFFVMGINVTNNQPQIIESEPYKVEKLTTIDSESEFYINKGYINHKLHYQYMIDYEELGCQLDNACFENAIILYDNKNPRVEWYKEHQDWMIFHNEFILQKIYVPINSVNEEFIEFD